MAAELTNSENRSQSGEVVKNHVDGSEEEMDIKLPLFGTGNQRPDVFDEDEDICVPLVSLPPPPDGGWGWVIVFASFMCNLILDGLAYTFGILMPPLVEHFESNSATVSWVGSLLPGITLTSGPIVGGLMNKFGCRPVCIFGSVLASIGFLLSIFSPNVPILMLTYGVLGGFGFGLVYLPAVVAVGYYFEKKRALATGISVCGSGVGTVVFAPLATYLLEQYGWKGTNLIFAALCLNCAVFGALMRPLELTIKPMDQIPQGDQDENMEDDNSSVINITADQSFTVQLADGSHHRSNVSETGAGLGMAIPALPPVVEESVTAFQKDEYRSIADVFPEVKVPPAPVALVEKPATTDDTPAAPTPAPANVRGRRFRTISETNTTGSGNSGRFHTSAAKLKKQTASSFPRNLSAPHFVDPNCVLPRNMSTPGFGRLTVLTSTEPGMESQEQVVFGLEGSQLLNTNQLCLQPGSRRGSRRYSRPIVRPLYRKDVFYSGSIMQLLNVTTEAGALSPSIDCNPPSSPLPRGSFVMSYVPSQATIEGYRHSVISIPKFYNARNSSTGALSLHRGSIVASHLSIPRDMRKMSTVSGIVMEKESDGAQPILSALKEMINLKLLSNRYFILMAISSIFSMLGFYVPFVYLPSMAQQIGVPLENANFLLSVIGISNTIGRVLVGWFSDFPWVNSLFVTNMSLLLGGIFVIVLPSCTSYAALMAVALMFGLNVAAFISLTSIVLVDLLGLDNLTSSFGLLVLFRGVASMFGSPLAGAVYDSTQRLDVAFYLAGGFLVISSAISFIAQIIQMKEKKIKSAML